MSKEIKMEIDAISKEIEHLVNPGVFTLNARVNELIKKIEKLQNQCCHNYIDGICEFCYKGEE